ncbi:F-box protein [Aspergillus tanneri]|uniref:F-box domain-containing protein n=1 Tax=Aspergillus tanneri TaxID=1220188 RepID=A0A5M9MTK2_9EURO|nr:uncharacterized protein ATNIH1004_002899 [Aspergillus tanneri]KAA8650218.1 hypothetical protein ATNIH1004_002899 [Aspergillus tanneri]
MASPILSTPPEILRMVFASLSPSDLCAVCLTHRDLRSLAELLLYAHIQWTWTSSQNPPIAQFLQSIVHRPELASFVHVVVLSGDSFDSGLYEYRQKSPKLPVTEVVLDRLVKCIERIHIPYAEQWIQELRAGTMDAFITLLLSQLSSLRYLYLGKNFTRESHFMGMMLRSALCKESQDSHLPSFTHLQDVSIVYPSVGLNIRKYTNVRNTADVLPLFYLPSVKQIRTLVDNPTTFIWPGEYPPNPLRLASLDLTMLREGHLGQILSVTRGLQKLQWDWYYRLDLEDYFVTDIIDLDQIAADLSHVQETLTDLTITAGSDVSQADPERPELTFRGSFKTFSGLHMLKKLEVPIPFLLGFSPWAPNVVCLEEALPKNIQWLTITDDLCLQQEWEWQWETEYLLRAVRLWLHDWKKSTPRLRGFCLLTKVMKVQDWDPVMIQGLRDIGAQTGIQVQIIEEPPKWAGQM